MSTISVISTDTVSQQPTSTVSQLQQPTSTISQLQQTYTTDAILHSSVQLLPTSDTIDSVPIIASVTVIVLILLIIASLAITLFAIFFYQRRKKRRVTLYEDTNMSLINPTYETNKNLTSFSNPVHECKSL